jgi:ferredoxin
MKIIHEKKKCIGCGSCVVLCPKYWKMGEDGRAHLLNSEFKPATEEEILKLEEKELGCNREAADVCPVQCIHIIKSK